MLRHVRRHGQDCDSFGKDRDCPSRSKKKCPFWVEGRHAGTRWHQSLRTNDERTAIRLVNRIIETGRLEFDEPRAAGVTVLQAIEAFLAEQTSRGMADSTLKSFRKFLIGSPNRANCRNPEEFSPTLMEFATDQAIETLTAFVAEPDLVAKFRQRWRVSQTTSLKQTERLKSFFKFAVDMKWITENPARTLRPPVDNDEPPVVPFTKVQVAAILQACGDTEYLGTFLLVMRYSGLATVDTVKLTPDRLEPTNHLRLHRTKTRTWVKVLLPTVVADRLRSLPVQAGGFWFWNRQTDSKHETATGNMRRQLRRIFGPEGANIALRDEEGQPILDRAGNQKYGHPYQMRHTFVLEQINAGASLERIAELLGNTYKIVEKHYSAWVQSRQKPLDETVAKSWDAKELASY
jgi:site-specific recombinase XerD